MRRGDGRTVNDTARERGAFTLLEVVVALAVSGVLLLGGRLFLESLGRAAASTTFAAYDADRLANADRFLRTLAGRLEVGTDQSHHFGGDELTVHFTSWCDTPAGWSERCDAVISFEPIGQKAALIAHLIPLQPRGDVGPRSIVLASGFRYGAFRYLNDPRAGGRWFVRWGEAISAPLAIGLILDSDTTIVRIGGRE